MNPLLEQFAQNMKGKNPQSWVMSMVQNGQIANPEILELISFAQKGDTNSLTNYANNFFNQNGINLQEINSFLSLMK